MRLQIDLVTYPSATVILRSEKMYETVTVRNGQNSHTEALAEVSDFCDATQILRFAQNDGKYLIKFLNSNRHIEGLVPEISVFRIFLQILRSLQDLRMTINN